MVAPTAAEADGNNLGLKLVDFLLSVHTDGSAIFGD